MSKYSRGDAIRLTNKTARSLRQQAKQQRTAIYAAATVISILMAALAVLLGMQHLIAVPLTVLAIIAVDALLILIARGRYLSLTAQAICTEAAARQLKGESAEQQRITTAKRDLERIKADLGMADDGDDEDDEDEDMYRPATVRKPLAPAPAHTAAPTQPVRIRGMQEEQTEKTEQPQPAAARRRRQARLQVLSNDEPDGQAN